MAKQIKTAIIAAIVVFAIASIPGMSGFLLGSAIEMAVTTFVGTLAAGIESNKKRTNSTKTINIW